jgi:hypothetical protein
MQSAAKEYKGLLLRGGGLLTRLYLQTRLQFVKSAALL